MLSATMSKLCIVLIFTLLLVGGQADSVGQKVDCIRQKLVNDNITKFLTNDFRTGAVFQIGSAYREKYDALRSTLIVRTKQALQEVWKDEQVVRTDSRGQMTIDAEAFSNFANRMAGKITGTAMTACKNKPDVDRMYREAARATQCVFEELKKSC